MTLFGAQGGAVIWCEPVFSIGSHSPERLIRLRPERAKEAYCPQTLGGWCKPWLFQVDITVAQLFGIGGVCTKSDGIQAPVLVDPMGDIFGSPRARVAERLWGSARRSGACWLSTAADRGVGYACIKIGKKVYDAHRIAYLLANGPIPPKLLVRHSCDVRRCINPAHLSVGTYQDNHDDMVKRGRRVERGQLSATHRARRDAGTVAGQKLDREKVERIRAEWAKGGHTQSSLGVLFGVGGSTIGRIIREERWTDDARPLPSPSRAGGG